jgi:hypothetical protein
MRRVADPRLARKSSASARRVRKARTYPRLRTPSNVSQGLALRSSISLARTIALRTSFFLRLGMLRLQIQGLVDGIVPRSAFDFHSLKRAANYMALAGGEPGAVEFVIGAVPERLPTGSGQVGAGGTSSGTALRKPWRRGDAYETGGVPARGVPRRGGNICLQGGGRW